MLSYYYFKLLCIYRFAIVQTWFIAGFSVFNINPENLKYYICLHYRLADSTQHRAGVSAPSAGGKGPRSVNQDPLQIFGNNPRPLLAEREGKEHWLSTTEAALQTFWWRGTSSCSHMSPVSIQISHWAAVLFSQVSFVKEAIMKVLNLVLIFSDRWQAGFGAWK